MLTPEACWHQKNCADNCADTRNPLASEIG
jgi:hypothetical protein